MGSEPSPFLVDCIPLVLKGTDGRRALDVACGEGRNSIYLAQCGFQTVAIDNSDVALDKARKLSEGTALNIDYRLLNVREQLPEGHFDLVVVVNFLLRPVIPRLYDILTRGGYFVMQVIMQTTNDPERRHNPEFVVASGELERLFSDFGGTIVRSSEDPERERARILFKKS
jgi:tellurite methyltransferase